MILNLFTAFALAQTPAVNAQQIPEKNLRVILTSTPVSQLELIVRVGSFSDPVGQEGLAKLSASTALLATQTDDQESFTQKIEELGGSLQISVAQDQTVISVAGLNENFEKILDLAMEAVLNPRFDEDDFDLTKRQQLNEISQFEKSNQQRSMQLARSVLFRGHPLSRLRMGSKASVSSISREHALNWWKQNITKDRIFAAGALTFGSPRLASILNSKLQGIPAVASNPVVVPAPTEPAGIQIFILDTPSKEFNLTIAGFGPSVFHPNRRQYDFGMGIFGGSMSGWMFTKIREETGWTYTAMAGLDSNPVQPMYYLYSTPLLQTTSSASLLSDVILREFQIMNEFGNVGVQSQSEFDDRRNGYVLSYPMSNRTQALRINQQAVNLIYGIPVLSAEEVASQAASWTIDSVKKTFSTLFTNQNLTISIVGPAQVAKAQLENFLKAYPQAKVQLVNSVTNVQ